ncbi:hypothetical protein OUZ56_014315 [Daphnia magna]|uniref:Uncharacterized protein n=1 Tax=Daphnia magna TaxID=35525 RepID=A0ABR0AJK2_9CRUS|nr:hypothetical protein OUZ56_014315 [Daphnia magna]
MHVFLSSVVEVADARRIWLGLEPRPDSPSNLTGQDTRMLRQSLRNSNTSVFNQHPCEVDLIQVTISGYLQYSINAIAVKDFIFTIPIMILLNPTAINQAATSMSCPKGDYLGCNH